MADELHTYRCSNCLTLATAPMRGRTRCVICYTPMKHIYSQPVETDADRALAARGTVFNPHVRKVIALCPQCGKQIAAHGVVSDGIKFCSEEHAHKYWAVWNTDVRV